MGLPVVHLITDRTLVADLPAHLAAALDGLPPGTVAVHLREKGLEGRALLQLALRLAEACRTRGQLLLVNDRLDVALACGAAGAHLPSQGVGPAEARRLLGSGALIGVSCHSADEVLRARQGGADFATYSPIWETPSKLALGAPVGLESLRAACRLGLPLVALGGVSGARAVEARAAGAAGVAAIRAWLDVADPAAAVRGLLAAAGRAAP